MKKITNILFLTILCVLFISCGEIYINMNNIKYTIEKDEYIVNEEIKINFKGSFLPDDEVLGIWIDISLFNNDDENAEMKIINRNGEVINWDDEDCRYYFPTVEKNYFQYFVDKKNMTEFDESISISIPNEGECELILSIRAESLVRYKGGISDYRKKILIKA